MIDETTLPVEEQQGIEASVPQDEVAEQKEATANSGEQEVSEMPANEAQQAEGEQMEDMEPGARELQTTEESPTHCESCNTQTELFDVPHAQEGNEKVWKYCQRCKRAHEIEKKVNEKLKETASVDPQKAMTPSYVMDVYKEIEAETPNE